MSLKDVPDLGVGIGYRNELRAFFAACPAEIDWYELVADRYFSSLPESWEWLIDFREKARLVPHGLDLSLGTDEPLDLRYARQAAELVRLVRAPFYTDHLCMTQAGGVQLGHLTPLPFTRRAARRVAEKVKAVQDTLGVPLLLENIAYSFVLPGEMSEADFVATVVEAADCGLLLDLTNLFVNSQNHGYDPYEFLGRLPLERVVQVHLAGSERHGGKWVDAHSRAVDAHPEVWSLLDHVVRRAPVKAVLLERDQNFTDDVAEELVRDLRHARDLVQRARGAGASTPPPSALPVVELGSTPAADAPPDAESERAFQTLLARLLVDPALRARLATDGPAIVREAGLPDAALAALQHAGVGELAMFASSLENKRFGMLSRSSPALYKLLELEGQLGRVQHELASRYLPVETAAFASRTIRDACWTQELVEGLVADGTLTNPLFRDVARFERRLLDLSTNPHPVESAKLFERARDTWCALSDDAIAAAVPRVGAHTAVERFGHQITAAIKALMAGALPDAALRKPTTVLFVKQAGLRNVQHFEINALTERLLDLCDGSRTTRAIGEALRARHGAAPSPQRTAAMIRQLAQCNVLSLQTSLPV